MSKMNGKPLLKLTILAVLVLSLVCSTVGCGGTEGKEGDKSGNADVQKLNVTFQPVYNGWATYDAQESGLAKENGFNIDMIFFDSGMPQIEAIPADAWDIGATGTIPGLMAGLRYDAYVIGVADDETRANAIMVKADSPILKTKGFNPEYPDVYGTPQDLKGKKILVPTVSSAHYVLATYLKAMGLTEKDVQVLNMEPAQAVAAFESGQGDAVALWAPFMFTAAEKGWKIVADGGHLKAPNPNLLVVPKKFGDEHPELVAKYLKMYFQHQSDLTNQGDKLVDQYIAYNKDWGGIDLSKEFAVQDMERHTIYTLDEEIKMFDKSNGQSDIEKTLAEMINFFGDQGKFTAEEREKLLQFDYVTDKFLKMSAELK
ncbi:MAG TPA: NrtA/SsuA/CpmA family ABC transporter substrate-binding protein [Syntrophomonas sp.]|nr:NrtA/SsuA/CpmA family ABC transporter substrate-binding protein [Syntrophomonas sp.]